MTTKELKIHQYKYYYSINVSDNRELDPVVFINGAFQTMKSWKKVVNYLDSCVTTIAVDLPGWGDADFLPDTIGFELIADSIKQILTKESIKKVSLVSLSFGTAIAVAFARKYPELVTSLVLSSPILIMDEFRIDNHRKMLELHQKQNKNKLAHFILNSGLLNRSKGESGEVHQYERMKDLFLRQMSNSDDTVFSRLIANSQRIVNEGSLSLREIGHIRMLTFTGEYDEFTSPKDCIKLALDFSQGNFTTIRNADHLFLIEKPEVTCQLLLRFFKNEMGSEINGCSPLFSMQKSSPKLEDIASIYESEAKSTHEPPLEEPFEFLPHPSRLQVSFDIP